MSDARSLRPALVFGAAGLLVLGLGCGMLGGEEAAGPVAVGAQPLKEDANFVRNMMKGGGPAPGITSAQCGSIEEGGALVDDCVTAEIQCGQTITGHTRGGVKLYDTDWYARQTCWPATRDHDGGDERIYRFDPNNNPFANERHRAVIYFDTPCADLDLSWMRVVADRGTCPDPRAGVKQCEMLNPFTRQGNRQSYPITMDPGEVYYFLVEGTQDEEGAFSLSLECGT